MTNFDPSPTEKHTPIPTATAPSLASSDAAFGSWSQRWPQMLLGCMALTLAALIWLHATGPGAGAGYDFAAYLQAARSIAAGQNPYHRLAVEYAHAIPGQALSANGYVYPPLLATLLAALIHLGLNAPDAWLLWNVVTALAVGWMCVEVARLLRAWRWPHVHTLPLAAILALATVAPAVAIYDLSLGQADLLVMALAALALAREARDAPGSWLTLGLAIAIKPQLAALLGVWLWQGRYRAVMLGAAAALLATLVPFAFAGGQGAIIDYLTFFTRWNALRGNAEYINQSLYGVTLRLFTANPYAPPLLVAPWLGALVRWLAVALTAGLWLWRIPRARPTSSLHALTQEALALPMILLISPLSEDIHYCLLIPPALLLLALSVGDWRRVPHGWANSAARWAVCLVFLALCVPRGQEVIYPTHLAFWPGQTSHLLGPLIVQTRASAFALLAAITLLVGLVLAA